MRKFAYWIVAAVIAGVGAAVTFVEVARDAAASDYSKTPILFVHGHGLSSNDWGPLKSYLSKQGYPPEYLSAIDIRPSRLANTEAAERFIAPAVEALLRQAASAAEAAGDSRQFELIDLVSHSMGAVSSRWYAARMRPERVRTWISIAGANHGSNALCNHTDAGAADLCPAYAEAGVQAMLNGAPGAAQDESPYGVGLDPGDVQRVPPDSARRIYYFTVRIEPDEWIVPADSAVLQGAGGVKITLPSEAVIRETSPGNFRSYRDLDHMSILNDEEVLRLCLLLLSATPAR